MEDQKQNQWENLAVVPASRGQITVQRQEHSALGYRYSVASSREGELRPGHIRLLMEVDNDGTVRCTNGLELLESMEKAINMAVQDFGTYVHSNGAPPAMRADRKRPGNRQSQEHRPKQRRTLDLTPEQRANRKTNAEAKKAQKRARDRQIRLEMQGKKGK